MLNKLSLIFRNSKRTELLVQYENKIWENLEKLNSKSINQLYETEYLKYYKQFKDINNFDQKNYNFITIYSFYYVSFYSMIGILFSTKIFPIYSIFGIASVTLHLIFTILFIFFAYLAKFNTIYKYISFNNQIKIHEQVPVNEIKKYDLLFYSSITCFNEKISETIKVMMGNIQITLTVLLINSLCLTVSGFHFLDDKILETQKMNIENKSINIEGEIKCQIPKTKIKNKKIPK